MSVRKGNPTLRAVAMRDRTRSEEAKAKAVELRTMRAYRASASASAPLDVARIMADIAGGAR